MILHRVLAAIILLSAAIGSALYWNNWRFEPTTIGINVMVASLGFLYLHRKWKAREERAITPSKAEDIFS